MKNGVTLDVREFDRAMVQYAAASGKDFKDIVHRQLNNLAIQGLKVQQRAKRESIKTLKDKPWWPLYVSKFLRNRQGVFTQNDYDRASKALIRKRLRGIGFLRAFFIRISQVVAPLTNAKSRKGKSFQGFHVTFRKATNRHPATEIIVGYPYKQRGAKTAQGADKLLRNVISRAIAATVLDMQKYIDRKMGKTARKYSAAGVR